ncbi:MAG TPA: alanine racemase, partial [Thermoanaerobaculia bacterium]|nr:alanine racemase [Thermoanaerobaculia bacterium]
AEVRRAGVRAPILMLGPIRREQLPLVRRYHLTPAVSSLEQLDAWLEWCASSGHAQEIHLKVDTGMRRLGIELEAVPRALAAIRAQPGLRLAGVLSHLADADDLDSLRNEDQEGRFESVLAQLTDEERSHAWLHLANSAGALHWPPTRHTLVRCGLALYGLDPAGREGDLRPVLSVHARVVMTRQVPTGGRVGYSGRWTALRPSRVGILQLGYADGYPWKLSNRAEALVEGRRIAVVGAVSMDMIAVDLTDTQAGIGAEVVLLGRQAGEQISAWEIAERAETIPYEILTRFGLRMARHYVREGEVVETTSRHLA